MYSPFTKVTFNVGLHIYHEVEIGSTIKAEIGISETESYWGKFLGIKGAE